MFVFHETLINKKKLIKNAIPIIKSPSFWYGNGFFLKRIYYYAFIVKQMQNFIYFLNGVSSKKINF